MATQAKTSAIKQLLTEGLKQPNLSSGTLLFIGQLLAVVVLTIALTEGMLHVNHNDIKSKLSNIRFMELQGLSDRINDALEQQQVATNTLSRFSLLPSLFNNDDQRFSNTKATLEELQSYVPAYSNIALLDAKGDFMVQVGMPEQLQISRSEIKQAINDLDGDRVFLSPLQLYGNQGKAYVWTLTQVQPNQRGIRYLLLNIEISELWSSLYSLSTNNIPLFIVNHQGQFISLTEANRRGNLPLEQRYPGLWRAMVEQGFGQWGGEHINTVFIKVRPSNNDAVYLFSYIDSREMVLEQRFRWQLRSFTALMIVFLCLYFWHKRNQRSERQLSQRALNLAETLYQSSSGSMLFSADGHCVGANDQLCQELDTPLNQLKDRRFNRLFSSEPLSIDMVWQLARGSGNWEGYLQLTGHVEARLRIKLSTLSLGGHQSLMLLQLQESPQQRQQTLKLQHIEQLCDSASGLALLDNQHQIISSNRAMASVCKTPMEQLVGRKWLDLLPLQTNEMQVQLENQLSSRGMWQSQVWIRRGDAAINRCLVSIQLTESNHNEELQRVLTLTPIQDLSLISDEDLTPSIKRGNLAQQLLQHPQPYVLMLLSIGNSSTVSSFADADQLLYRQHLILQQLAGALPPEAILGQFNQPSEILLLLPNWHHTQAAHLAANLLKLLDDADLGEQITIGLSQCDIDANWAQLLDEAQSAIERARMTGQRYCLAYTRIPKEPS